MQFHTPSHSIPPLDSLLEKEKGSQKGSQKGSRHIHHVCDSQDWEGRIQSKKNPWGHRADVPVRPIGKSQRLKTLQKKKMLAELLRQKISHQKISQKI